MHILALVLIPLLALAAYLAPAQASAQACTASNGTFRFLNDQFPPLSTNGPVFTGQLVVANADGAVTFSIDPGSTDPLPAGLSLDPDSGLITGLATQSGSEDVTFRADDGTQFITHLVQFSISSAGGGGNGGSGLANPVFPDGTVDTPYSHTPVPDGDGPFTFGGSDLPPGLTLDGATGEISGTPTAPGTFFMTLSVYDDPPGDENVGATLVPITILPVGSSFAFVTQFLNNGEVGTPFCDQYVVENPAFGGVMTFGASGLAPGLVLDPATGAVTGTPTTPGSFVVTISANDGTDTITTNLSMVMAASSTSAFHWNYLGLPAALVYSLYDNNPAIGLTAEAALGAITYVANGLPAGITYDVNTGELTGTPTAVGEYPVTVTATDGGSAEVITLDLVFIVLPATGGDVSQITVNFWVRKASLRLGEDGSESQKISAIYNADRRTGTRYDPATDTFKAQLGSHLFQVDPGECIGKVPDQSCAFKTPKGVIPVERLKLTPDKQILAWSTSKDTFTETVPGVLTETVSIGAAAYRLPLRFDDRGSFRPALDFDRAAFVLAKGAIVVRGPGLDQVKLTLLLADQNLSYEEGVTTLRVRVLEGATVLFDRDFTALGGPEKEGTDKRTGKPIFAFKTLKDTGLTDRVKMAFASSKGTMKLALTNLDLTGISPGEAHLGIEVTIGNRVHTTYVTFFETKPGKYGLSIP